MKRFATLLVVLLAFPALAHGPYRIGTSQSLAYTHDAQANTATQFEAYTTVVRITVTSDAYIAIAISGATASATAATGTFLPADTPEYFIASAGETIGIPAAAVSGTLFVTEFTK